MFTKWRSGNTRLNFGKSQRNHYTPFPLKYRLHGQSTERQYAWRALLRDYQPRRGDFAYAPRSRFDRRCPGRSRTWCFTTNPRGWATCGATVESMCLSFAAIGIAPQCGIGRDQFSRRHDLWRSATPHALHRVRSSRRRRWPLMAASWLIGRRRSRTPLVHSHVGLLQPIYKRFPLGSDLCDKRCSDAFVELQQLVDRH